MSGDNYSSFKTFKPFNRYAPFKPPPRITSGAGSLVLPRDAGEDEGGYKPVASFTKQTGHMVYSLRGRGKEELANALGTDQCHGSTS